MSNTIVFIGKNKNNLIDFLLLNKEINVVDYKTGFKYFRNLFVFFSYEIKDLEVEKEIKKINLLTFTNYIFLPIRLKNLKINKIHKVLFYPLDIKKFEHFLNRKNNSYFFGDINLDGGFLVNQKKN